MRHRSLANPEPKPRKRRRSFKGTANLPAYRPCPRCDFPGFSRVCPQCGWTVTT